MFHDNNLSAGTKCYRRLRNNYACLQVLVNNTLTWQSSCVIANNARKQQKLFVQGYNLEVHDGDMPRANQLLCDLVSRSRNRLSSPSVRFTPC